MSRNIVESLAERAAAAERSSLDYQHRYRELSSGRVFRTVTFLKRFFTNPIKGVRYITDIPSLLKKAEVAPLTSKLPTAQDIIDDATNRRGVAPLNSGSIDLRYPHIKCAVVGNVGVFNQVCHAFRLDSGPWEYLLDVGIEMLLVDKTETYDPEVAQDAFRKFSDQNIPIVFYVHTKQDTDDKDLKYATHIIYSDSDLQRSVELVPGVKVIYLSPSVDITLFNPIDWARKPKTGLYTTGEPPKELTTNIKPITPDQDDFYNLAKQGVAVITEEKDYDSSHVFTCTVVNLIASGVPVISTGNPTLRDILGADYPFADNPQEYGQLLSDIQSTEQRERHSIYWRRHVIENHSSLNRYESLLKELSIPTREQEMISIIHSTSRPELLKHAVDNIERQDYKNKELILVLHGDKFDKSEVEKVTSSLDIPHTTLYRPADTLFGDNLNLGVDIAHGTLVTKMDDDDWYGPNHLRDLVTAIRYSGADIVGKWGNFVYLSQTDQMVDFATKREEHFVHQLPGATILARRDILQKVRFGRVKRAIDSELHRRLAMRGGRLYSTHRYNFIRVRHTDHTYKIEDEAFIADSDSEPSKGLDLDGSFV